ncbi:cytochrome c oxidase accessory protein CcoG [Pseudothauera nasutitermitis]|uniref:Cytochrome c oxidase accessory protein CcoG n=1 Tax=Pseudothauera nasutitermitis TaxID=2565930 RepID=A0A4S4B0F5_9RHOO|nr:cytochrome c oxidase accessory protein CcoG [Pseudothauera nasutitermitis]THF65836.1 cytochrome c oxidase accessory protein CcoG [Pseudothauera nasutitermitis]
MNSTNPKPQSAGSPKPPDNSNDTFYAARKKLQVRSVSGMFANWRWALVWITQLLFYGLPWLVWNDRQAVLFHLVERKFYVFGWVFWPQDVFYLAIILIISAYALFFFTAIAGRLWCGYACPQTVYTEIFMWIEEKIEGDRNARMKLDKAPMSGQKLFRRGSKYAVWALFALWTGFTFVAYFSPLRELLQSAVTFSFGPWELFWILFYGGFTYLFAGLLREQVCKYMCPYARFQGVMFDPDTLVITYDEERGEPRGTRKKGIDPRAEGKGDCVDCGICVQVCPTGIDIRDGLQYECIGCAACIDACDQVMDKMQYPRGLIRYSTENALKKHWGMREILLHVLRPRTLIYGGILAAFCVALAWGLATRSTLRVDIIRDRAALATELADGTIENVYRLQVMNMTEGPRSFEVRVGGLDGAVIRGTGRVEVAPATTQAVTVQVAVPPSSGKPGANKLHFDVQATDDASVAVREETTFLMPH